MNHQKNIARTCLAFSFFFLSTALYAENTTKADPSIIAYWSFERVNNSVISDASGNNHHLFALEDGRKMQLVSGILGRALKTSNCTKPQLIVANSGFERFNFNNFSIELVASIDNVYSTQNLFVNHTIMNNSSEPDAHKGYGFYIQDGHLVFVMASENGDSWFIGKSSWQLQSQTLYHFVVTFDGFDVVLYIDGYETERWYRPGSYKSSVTEPKVGYNHYSPGLPQDFFKGILDEFKIFNRALTSYEVEQHYSALFPKK